MGGGGQGMGKTSENPVLESSIFKRRKEQKKCFGLSCKTRDERGKYGFMFGFRYDFLM